GVTVFYCASLCSKEEKPVYCEIETEQAVIELVDFFKLHINWNDGRTEESETPDHDIHQDRQILLRSLAGSLTQNRKPLVTVEECRSYMLAWNGAFESFGVPKMIAEKYINPQQT